MQSGTDFVVSVPCFGTGAALQSRTSEVPQKRALIIRTTRGFGFGVGDTSTTTCIYQHVDILRSIHYVASMPQSQQLSSHNGSRLKIRIWKFGSL